MFTPCFPPLFFTEATSSSSSFYLPTTDKKEDQKHIGKHTSFVIVAVDSFYFQLKNLQLLFSTADKQQQLYRSTYISSSSNNKESLTKSCHDWCMSYLIKKDTFELILLVCRDAQVPRI